MKLHIPNVPQIGHRIINSQRKISGGFSIIYLGSVFLHLYFTHIPHRSQGQWWWEEKMGERRDSWCI